MQPDVACGGEDLVGRAAERSLLDRAWHRARSGDSSLVVVEGEAGIGKSALIRHLIATRSDASVVLPASGEESERRLDFGIVEQLYDEATAIGLESCLPFGRGGHRPDPLDVGAALLDLLRSAATNGPALIVIDDGQWSDHPSLQAVTFALRRLRRLPTLIVIAMRPDAALLDPILRLCADG